MKSSWVFHSTPKKKHNTFCRGVNGSSQVKTPGQPHFRGLGRHFSGSAAGREGLCAGMAQTGDAPTANCAIHTAKSISHHLKSIGNHCLLGSTGESLSYGFLGGVGFRPSTVGVLFGCFGRKNGWRFPGLPGGLIIHQGNPSISPKRTPIVSSRSTTRLNYKATGQN